MRDAAPPRTLSRFQWTGAEPRAVAAPPAGNPGDYPRMLYHPDGRTTVVDTPERHDRLKPDGWEIAPLACIDSARLRITASSAPITPWCGLCGAGRRGDPRGLGPCDISLELRKPHNQYNV
jgi:hypothetical protein